ncbi:MAG: DUF262 domain-containing protein, partial [Kamptonema sp. SIO4C4]|nr:DUF262 domain-containing protein [Kamptonema sp. SIO4C4]
MNIKLLEGEKIEFNSSLNNPKNYQSTVSNSHEINEKYIQGKRRIVTEQARYPLESIISMIDSGKYKLDPYLQRRRRWDNVKKSRLIESFILNIPVPPIFLYEENYASYEVMDGQQRMRTIYDFYKDEFKLTGLEEWNDLNGYTYSQLPDRIKAGIDRKYISSIIILTELSNNNEQQKGFKQLVFERINSGSVHLTAQEIRNALYDGKLNRLCLELSGNKYFQSIWNLYFDSDGQLTEDSNHDFYKQMDDVELVLRFFAFRQIDKMQSSLKKTLDHFLIKGNNFDQ